MIQITSIKGSDEKQFVFFTAMEGKGYSENCFHYMPVAKKMGYRSWFLRDTSNSFYHTKNIQPMMFLTRQIVRGFKGKSIFVGSSMGAYGAIFFGNRCQPSKVIAFSPTPPTYKKQGPLKVPCDIHVCRNSKWSKVNGKTDVENALLFSEGSRIIYHDCDKHNVAGFLKDRSTLYQVLQSE